MLEVEYETLAIYDLNNAERGFYNFSGRARLGGLDIEQVVNSS